MSRRALVFVFLLFSGAAALLAGHFGLYSLPYQLETESAAKRPDALTSAAQTAADLTAALTGTAPPKAQGAVTSGTTLDVTRISPEGSSVFAGRAKPNAVVTVLEGGKPVGSVKADENGEWSLVTEHKFASLDPSLTFRTGPEPPNAQAGAPLPEVQPPRAANGAPDKAVQSTPAPAAETSVIGAASAQAVAAELMNKFEKLVADAREEAKAERVEPRANPEVPAPAVTPPSPPPVTGPALAEAAEPHQRPAAAPSHAADEASTPEARAAAKTSAAIPIPIMFVYNEANFTSEGQRAADLLLEYLKLKHLEQIALSGHADERGSDIYNMDLSRERLAAVERHLRNGGFGGHLDLIPKGKTEPFTGVDRTKYSGEALYQLDRRVELRSVQ